MKLKLTLIPLTILGLTAAPIFAETAAATPKEQAEQDSITLALVSVKGGG